MRVVSVLRSAEVQPPFRELLWIVWWRKIRCCMYPLVMDLHSFLPLVIFTTHHYLPLKLAYESPCASPCMMRRLDLLGQGAFPDEFPLFPDEAA